MMDFKAALTCLDKAVTLKPDYPEALNNRAGISPNFIALMRLFADYDRALAIRPTSRM